MAGSLTIQNITFSNTSSIIKTSSNCTLDMRDVNILDMENKNAFRLYESFATIDNIEIILQEEIDAMIMTQKESMIELF
jgi:hypothetical protein